MAKVLSGFQSGGWWTKRHDEPLEHLGFCWHICECSLSPVSPRISFRLVISSGLYASRLSANVLNQLLTNPAILFIVAELGVHVSMQWMATSDGRDSSREMWPGSIECIGIPHDFCLIP